VRHIDWSKAPEWAEGHALVAHHGITEAWINPEQYALVGAEDRTYAYGSDAGKSMYNFTRGQIQYITPRPDRWDGAGLPPVGSEVEAKILDGNGNLAWRKCRIVHHHPRNRGSAAVAHGNEELLAWADGFRPIRTPEQIAADERLHSIRNAITAINKSVEAYNESLVCSAAIRATVEAMVDAGYRKQATP